MRRMIYVSVIAGYLALLLSRSGDVLSQSLVENKSTLHGTLDFSRGPETLSEGVKETVKRYSDNFNTDAPFVAGIPGKLEAESWDTKSGGMYAIPTTDAGGGMKVVGITNGSWMDYNVTVAQSGNYTVNFRVATTHVHAQFQILSGNTVLATINIPGTGDWNNWLSFPVSNVPLTAGPQTIRIQSINDENCDFNWMDWALTTSTNTPPTANAGTDQTITLPTNSVTLTGSGTDDGTITAYQWTRVSGPATYTIASPTTASTAVNNLVEGIYQFELKVTDNDLATATDIVTITVIANQPAPGNWNLAGNSGTSPATNFLGTTDNVKLGIRTNNLERFTVLANGKIGINTPNPQFQLEINNATPDNHLKINGTSPSIMFSGTGLGVNDLGRIGLATINNNFTQGTVPGDFILQSLGASSNLILGTGGGGSGNGVERARINPVGYFGIGTLNPTAKLHVNCLAVGGQTNPSNIRFENLALGTGTPLVMDANGYVFAGTGGASNTWNITGNAGTNATNNFLGTTDNNRLVFRTNNTEKMTILTNGKVGIGTTNPQVSLHISASPGSITGFPYEVAVLEKSSDMKLGVFCSNPSPIGTNASGASIALGYSSFTNTAGLYPGYEMQFLSLSSSSSILRFNAIQRNAAGLIANSVDQALILDNNGNVGINLGFASPTVPNLPTAKFHTNGNVRLQGLPTGTGNVLVVDANGNVFKSTTTAFTGTPAVESAGVAELKNEIEKLKEEIESLRSVVNSMKSGTLEIDVNRDNAFLYQNTPNPFNSKTSIRYYLPSGFQKAVLEISDLQGRVLKNYQLAGEGKQSTAINANELSAGTYIYTLIVNEKRADSKKMVLTR